MSQWAIGIYNVGQKMTRETYLLAKPAFYLACVALGVAFSCWPRRSHPKASVGQKAVLTLGSAVAVIAVTFPWAIRYVEERVPIRDEGLQLAYEYLILVGPAALATLILSIANAEIRKAGCTLSFIYILGGVGILGV